MAKTSGRLDTNLEASGKVESIMLRSTIEVTKSWKEKESEEEGSVATYYKHMIDVVGKRLVILRRNPITSYKMAKY